MKITVNYIDGTQKIFENITKIFKLNPYDDDKTELDYKEEFLKNANIYQLIGENVNCTLDLISKKSSYAIIEF